jgi:hypothetical protein
MIIISYIPKEISSFNAARVGHTVIKLTVLRKCIGDENGMADENKGPRCNEILQLK